MPFVNVSQLEGIAPEKLAKAVKYAVGPPGGSNYVTFNLVSQHGKGFSNELVRFVHSLKKDNSLSIIGEELSLFTREGSILVLIGDKGFRVKFKGKDATQNATRLHVDRIDAMNICFLFHKPGFSDLSKPAAVWLFVHHTYIQKCLDWLSRKYPMHDNPFDDVNMSSLSPPDMQEFLEFAQADASWAAYTAPPVSIIFQHHAEVMYVPASYWHCVWNLELCIKFAWDTLVVDRLVTYALTQVHVLSKNLYHGLSHDYVGLQPLLVEVATYEAILNSIDAVKARPEHEGFV